jgi:uncharacterized protein (UPF0261 family)
MKTSLDKETLKTWAVAAAMTLLATGVVLAQGADVLGTEQVSQSAITTMKLIAVAGIGYGFLRFMSGRHTVEGLTLIGVGGLGLAKTQAIVGLLGLG